jgi:plastocyanin
MKNQKLLIIATAGIMLLLVSTTYASRASVHTIAQKNKSFVLEGSRIESLSVKLGDVIKFKNRDPFFHNVFSLSDIKTFDLGSYPAGKSKSITADKLGIMEVECAIHPQMFLKVEVEN